MLQNQPQKFCNCVILTIIFSDLQEDLAAIQNNPARAQFCSQRLLCRTLAGNNVYILTITAPASQEDMKRKEIGKSIF